MPSDSKERRQPRVTFKKLRQIKHSLFIALQWLSSQLEWNPNSFPMGSGPCLPSSFFSHHPLSHYHPAKLLLNPIFGSLHLFFPLQEILSHWWLLGLFPDFGLTATFSEALPEQTTWGATCSWPIILLGLNSLHSTFHSDIFLPFKLIYCPSLPITKQTPGNGGFCFLDSLLYLHLIELCIAHTRCSRSIYRMNEWMNKWWPMQGHISSKLTFLLVLFVPAGNLRGSGFCLTRCKVCSTMESNLKITLPSKTHSKCWLIEQYLMSTYSVSETRVFMRITSINLNKSIWQALFSFPLFRISKLRS